MRRRERKICMHSCERDGDRERDLGIAELSTFPYVYICMNAVTAKRGAMRVRNRR